MIYKGIAATTHADAHNMIISKEALEKAAFDISNGKYVPSFGVGHDLTIMPIGKVYKAYVDKFDEEDYALYTEQEVFDNIYDTIIDGEKYILAKSEVDNRPFALDEITFNEKLVIEADPVNFESHEKLLEYSSNLNDEFGVDVSNIFRKSVIPDPELVFKLVESSVKYLFIYLSSKQVIERVGDALVDTALNELKSLYEIIKKAIRSGTTYLLPKDRPVTYVFRGNLDYLIELVIKTKNPDTAIESVGKDKLKEVIDKIDGIKEQFSMLRRVQFIYNEIENKWEFNYLTTEKGEVIGTEKSYKKSAKLVDLYLRNSDEANISIGGSL